MRFNYADTIKKLPPYIFAEIDRKKKELIEKGVDIISFGVGDPDLPTPEFIIEAMKKAIFDPKHHQYPFGKGIYEFRNEIAKFYKRRFNVDLNVETEIHALIGSKEGIAHITLGFLDAGDIALCPEPGYPAYASSTLINKGEVYYMPLKEENGYFPKLEKIPEDILKRAKIMFLNSPNNPTAAVYNEAQFKKAIEFAKKYNIIIAHDAAYTEIYYDNKKPISFLEVEGAKEVGIEFHSLSKTYNMTGWRIGFIVGNREIVKGLGIVKDNFDSGVFSAIQEAGSIALEKGDKEAERLREIYQKRRDFFIDNMKDLGWDIKAPSATFYVWAKTLNNMSSTQFATLMLDKCGIVVTPGNGFGVDGEGYIRFALTVDENRMKEAFERMKSFF
ncbi:MAG: LL-diaminopimelate aminotransferase [Elusimicrobiota bacterium]|jgi:LL-diaminopimelate aminotransferase|nr:LL-diaminopimelate aminotransferase [Elusimicrobiota bacterium]